MGTTLNYTATVNIINCSECGTPIALMSNRERALREDHSKFYCPNGHNQYFPQESAAERAARLEKELAVTQQRVDEWRKYGDSLADSLNRERKSHSATKGQLTRTRKRAVAAVCPLCHRTFKQVAAHMKSKHPGESEAGQ